MSVEDNQALVRAFLEQVWNERHFDAIEETIAPDYILHDSSGAPYPPGPAGYRLGVTRFLGAFPDLHTTIEEVVGDGDKVVVRGTDRATHQGEFMGIPPTGRPVTLTWTASYRVAGGKIVEQWIYMDSPDLLQQLGGSSAPPNQA